MGHFPRGFAVAVLAIAATGCGSHSSWSSWQPPSGDKQQKARAIAKHIESGYRLTANGERLVAVIATEPEVTVGKTKLAIGSIAVRKSAGSNQGVTVYKVDKTQVYTLCGLGGNCAIPGVATQERGRVVRREALEVALTTLKYSPELDSVLTYLPQVPGRTFGFAIFLQRSDVESALEQPLSKTLTRTSPPLPTDVDATEAKAIDTLTLAHLYLYAYTALDGGNGLILEPPGH